MPIYVFLNNETGETEEHSMSWKNLDQFKEDNPQLTQQVTAANISYKGAMGTLQRAGDGWKEVQDRIKSGLPPRLRDNIKTK